MLPPEPADATASVITTASCPRWQSLPWGRHPTGAFDEVHRQAAVYTTTDKHCHTQRCSLWLTSVMGKRRACTRPNSHAVAICAANRYTTSSSRPLISSWACLTHRMHHTDAHQYSPLHANCYVGRSALGASPVMHRNPPAHQPSHAPPFLRRGYACSSSCLCILPVFSST
jgi:hypothetical protein